VKRDGGKMRLLEEIISADRFQSISIMFLILAALFYYMNKEKMLYLVLTVHGMLIVIVCGTLHWLEGLKISCYQGAGYYIIAFLALYNLKKKWKDVGNIPFSRIAIGILFTISYILSLIISSNRFSLYPEYALGIVFFIFILIIWRAMDKKTKGVSP
jgi:hypothetical protein